VGILPSPPYFKRKLDVASADIADVADDKSIDPREASIEASIAQATSGNNRSKMTLQKLERKLKSLSCRQQRRQRR
jgi:hypothetical protein